MKIFAPLFVLCLGSLKRLFLCIIPLQKRHSDGGEHRCTCTVNKVSPIFTYIIWFYIDFISYEGKNIKCSFKTKTWKEVFSSDFTLYLINSLTKVVLLYYSAEVTPSALGFNVNATESFWLVTRPVLDGLPSGPGLVFWDPASRWKISVINRGR